MSHGFAAILIVNGGQDPPQGQWLRLCLDKVRAHTREPHHHLYVWNNNIADRSVTGLVGSLPNATLLNADPAETLVHPHAVPLQRLYERAVADGARHIVTLDSDAHPLRDDWLTGLINALDDKTVLAGIWRDELATGIEPYLHASCLCVTVDFIREHALRFDAIPDHHAGKRSDTLSTFTDQADQLGLGIHKLRRSNRNNIHHLIGGIYGDTIYHHGAGSRAEVFFWGGQWTAEADRLNRQFRDTAAALLFEHYDRYIAWLRGGQETVFILGMHRSGTSCLAGCLERCGLHLGDVNRANPHNPRGNHELRPLVQLHESVLNRLGGSWSNPPAAVAMTDAEKKTALEIIAPVLATSPAGIKEPRLLLLLDDWLNLFPSCQRIGAYRHPAAVAQSLSKRDSLSEADAARLWLRYNDALARHHRANPFPLISFDIAGVDDYAHTVACAAVALGLQPDLAGIRSFVNDELRHGARSTAPAPDVCRETFDYLESHQYRPGPFEEGIVRLSGLRAQAGSARPAVMKNVIILGAGRSGTSAVAGMLARAGYYMGDNLWPARPMNPRGFFEDRDVNHINERLIESAWRRRYKWLPRFLRPRQPGEWQRWLAAAPVGMTFRERPNLRDPIRRLTAQHPFCLKDPRFCYTLPVWLPHLTNTVFVCVFRDPASAAESIVKACRTDPDMRGYRIGFRRALRVWTLMYRHVLEHHCRHGDWLFLDYNQLMDGTAAGRLARFTGATVDATFVDASLRRAASDRRVPATARAIYRQLRALSSASE